MARLCPVCLHFEHVYSLRNLCVGCSLYTFSNLIFFNCGFLPITLLVAERYLDFFGLLTPRFTSGGRHFFIGKSTWGCNSTSIGLMDSIYALAKLFLGSKDLLEFANVYLAASQQKQEHVHMVSYQYWQVQILCYKYKTSYEKYYTLVCPWHNQLHHQLRGYVMRLCLSQYEYCQSFIYTSNSGVNNVCSDIACSRCSINHLEITLRTSSRYSRASLRTLLIDSTMLLVIISYLSPLKMHSLLENINLVTISTTTVYNCNYM